MSICACYLLSLVLRYHTERHLTAEHGIAITCMARAGARQRPGGRHRGRAGALPADGGDEIVPGGGPELAGEPLQEELQRNSSGRDGPRKNPTGAARHPIESPSAATDMHASVADVRRGPCSVETQHGFVTVTFQNWRAYVCRRYRCWRGWRQNAAAGAPIWW